MAGLSGLRVIELVDGRIASTAAAYAGKLMAGFGAEVLRVDTRTDTAFDASFVWLNTGKTSAPLAPFSDAAALENLIVNADFLFDGLGAGGLEKLGLVPARLAALNPRLILTRIAPFGLDGPYRDYQAEEITLYAMAGLMYCTGDGARAPLNAGAAVCGFTAGLKAYVAALMAWLRMQRSGVGDVVELSMHETGIDNFEIAVAEYLNVGKVSRRNNDEHALVPWRAFPCKDGYATIIGGPIRNWRRGAALFEAPELLGPDFAHAADRIKNRARFRELITPWLMRTDKRSVYHAGQAAGLAWSYVANLQDALDSPQAAARKFFIAIDQPGFGPCRMPDAPFLGTRLHWATTPAVAPLAALPAWPPRAAAPSANGKADAQPLAGLKVVDFTHDWAGPHAARLLADYGAEVIKIEYPARLDGMRGAYLDKIEDHPRFWQLHRGKRSVALDLRVPDQLAACRALIDEADIVIENSRPGVMARLGLGYAVLQATNPRLVMVSLSAFGATGPESDYAGYGGSIEALSGLQSLTAYDPAGPFIRIREMDVLNGIMGDCAILTALAHRATTGEGQWLDLSESEACTWMIGEQIVTSSRGGARAAALGNRDALHTQGCYPCLDEDRWVVLTIRSDAEWHRLADTLGADAADARFASADARRANHDAFDALVADWTGSCDAASVMAELQAQRLACGRVATARDLAEDPHLAARRWFIGGADGRFPGFPFRFARGGGEYRGRAPRLGADNEAVLGRLGLTRSAWPDLSRAKLGTAFDEP